MEQFPKIAKVRMTAQATGEHPEAERLNAFAENALASGERESVMTHLATCANCREIVSLAVEARPEGSVSVKPVRDGFRWATFQWAAVAASVAIVTVAVLVVGPKETKAPQRATELAASRKQSPEPMGQLKQPESPVADLKAGRVASSKTDANAKALTAGKEVAGGRGAVSGSGNGIAIADGGFGGIGVYSRNVGQKDASTDTLAKLQEKKEAGTPHPAKAASSRDLAYSAPALRANDTFYSSVQVNRAAQGSVQGGIAQGVAPPATAADGERARAEEQGKSNNEISKDKRRDATAQASTESVAASSQAVAPAPAASAKFSKEPASPSEQHAGVSPGALIAFSGAGSRAWRLNSWRIESSDDVGRTWQDRTPGKNFQVSAIAVGQQVWAGGKAGALFISRDNGQTWAKISLTGDDIIPLGDVTEIKITNPQLVDVILNGGDDWQTNDGGKSFRLLPRKP